jgi:di/tricarboxylate transporter
MSASRRAARAQGLALAGLVLLLWLAPPLGGLPGTTIRGAILIVCTVGAWASGLLAEPVNTLVFFLLAVVFQVAKPAVVFSGFHSDAWWLVFGGAITGIAVQTTGLGQRLAGLFFGRSGGSYRGAVTAVAVAAVGLAFVMPSASGRIMLLTPIVLAFADRLGLVGGRPGRTGLVLTAGAATYMPPTAILPANVPNTVLLGASDTLYGIKLTYGPYLLLHFPILGALKTVLLVWLVCRLFPEPGPLTLAPAAASGRWSREERLLAVVLAISLLLFATDFAHGISPAWVSLGAGIVCLLPAFGLVTPQSFAERTNVTTLIYVAGFLGLGAVVAATGLGALLSQGLLHLAGLVPGDTTANLAALAVIGAGLGLLTTLSGLPAVLTPLAGDLAQASGLPLYAVLMLQVVVFSTVILPYQSPPMMIAMQLGRVSLRAGARLTLPLAALTVLALIPLDYLWWRWLGIIP